MPSNDFPPHPDNDITTFIDVPEDTAAATSESNSATPHPISALASAITSMTISNPLPNTTNATPLKEFHLFPNLVIELRLKIWEHAANKPRLIHWSPGTPPPSLLSANQGSRGVSFRHFTLCFNPLRRTDFYAIYINMNVDTVYRKQILPNLTRIRETPPYPMPLTMDIGIPAGPGWNVRYWSRGMRRLCINIHEAAAVPAPATGGAHPRLQNVWTRIRVMCPDLEELVVVIPRGGRQPIVLSDLVDLPVRFGTQRERDMMANLGAELVRVKAAGHLSGLSLLFQTI